MAKRFSKISDDLQSFIKQQKIFFVGTACCDGRVNVSPKGTDTFRVISKNKVIWLNLTGSGNETAAHLREESRMTIMFCSFEEKPLILRLYGHAKAFHPRDEEWNQYISLFPSIPGARQIIDLDVDLVKTSCGMAVPYYNFSGEREQLKEWAEKKDQNGLKEYWEKENQISLDGKPTKILG